MSRTQTNTEPNKKSTKRKTSDALEILDRVTGDDPKLRGLIDEATVNAHVAQLIYDARTAAGLTQRQLADLAGSTQPTIARLENADYEGHSLSMLRRIADTLQLQIKIDLVPITDAHRQRA